MRKVFFTVCFFVSTLNICRGQDTIRMYIALVKESPKIDSLIAIVLKSVEKFGPGTRENLRDDSCFLLNLNKSGIDNGYIQDLQAHNHRTTITAIGNFFERKNLYYFEFKGYTIFVYGDEFMKSFFYSTDVKREFVFIKPPIKQLMDIVRNGWGWALFYSNGEFSYGVH